MTKNELFTAMALITILLISVLWKEELYYRKNLSSIETNIGKKEKALQDSIIWLYDLEVTTSDDKLKKTKRSSEPWLKKYGKYLHPQSNS